MTKPTVSVLVPTHQDAQLLPLALPVFAELGDSVEIIVINNDPAQDVQAIVATCFPEARVVEMGFDSGFGRAMNVGIQHSRGEFVLILNADVFLTPSYVPEMLSFLSRHPRAGCAGGKVYRYDLKRQDRRRVLRLLVLPAQGGHGPLLETSPRGLGDLVCPDRGGRPRPNDSWPRRAQLPLGASRVP